MRTFALRLAHTAPRAILALACLATPALAQQEPTNDAEPTPRTKSAEVKPLLPAKTLKTRGGPPRALTFSHNGKSLAAVELVKQPMAGRKGGAGAGAGGGAFGGGGAAGVIEMSYYDHVVLWNLKSGKIDKTFPTLAPDELNPKPLTFEEAKAGKLPEVAGLTSHLAFTYDDHLLGGLSNAKLRSFDVKSGRVRVTHQGHNEGSSAAPILMFVPSPEGKRLMTHVIGDRSLRLWDTVSGKLLGMAQDPFEQYSDAHYSANGKLLALCNHDAIDMFDASTMKAKQRIDAGGRGVISVGLTPDGKKVRGLTLEGGGRVREWDVATGKLERTIVRSELFKEEPKFSWHSTTQFSPDASLLVVVRAAKPYVLFEMVTGKQTARFDACIDPAPVGVAFSSDGKQLATASGRDDVVKIWDVEKLRNQP